MIKVTHLCRSYGKYKAVQDVSFEVGKGEILGLLGPNGAGKTTLMKILTGYHFPTSGSAEIDGLDIQASPQAVQAKVGYLPENAPVYTDLTVTEYLEFMAGAKGLSQASIAADIERVITLTGLTGVRHKVVGHLSKGYRQRTGLAQAILGDPQILILDEPTSGLDPNQILEFRQLIKQIGASKTVILSTHIMQEVEAICQKVLIMNEGQIVAEGTPADIARKFHGEAQLLVSLKGLGQSDALKAFKDLPQLLKAPEVMPGETPSFLLTFAKDEPAGELVFDWAVAKGAKLVSLVPQTLSLENLFAKLTKEADKAPAEAKRG